MPSNTATARLIIEIREGQATRSLRRVDRGMQRATRRTNVFRRSIHALSSFTATLTKALISMVGVLIAFNLFITLPQAAFRALIGLIRVTVSTLAEFEQRILGLQGILASTVRFLQDPVENFRNAGLVATGVIETLALRANEMVTSLTEATIVFQTLLATGAQRSVRDVDKLIDLTILLSNSIAGITTGQSRQRQLAEETRSLFTQQLRANSLLTRILFKNRQEMREFFREAERTDTVVEKLSDRLRGFALVARDLGRTVEGIQTTFLTLLQVIARRAFSSLLEGVEQRVASIFEEIQQNTDRLNLLAASLGAAVLTIVGALRDIVEDTFGIVIDESTNYVRLLFQLVPTIVKAFLTIIFTIEDTVQVLRIAGNVVQILFNGFRNFVTVATKALDVIIAIVAAFKALAIVAVAVLTFFGVLNPLLAAGVAGLILALDNTTGPLDALRESLAEGFLGNSFARDFQQIDDALASLESRGSIDARVREAFARFRPAYDQLRAEIAADAAAIEEAERRLLTVRRIDLETNILITNELLRQTRATRSQVSNITQLIRLSQAGVGGRNLISSIGGSITDLEAIVREQIRQLGIQLQRNIFDLSTAQAPGNIGDTQQIEKLSMLITQIRGEMAALEGDLVALTAAFGEFGRVTVQNLSDSIGNLILGGTFQQLFELLNTEGAQLRSLFKNLTSDILDFIKSAGGQIAIISGIGNALSGAIKNALSGTQGFGASLKQLLGDLLIAIGQALIVAGAASVLFGLLTLDARLIGEGVVAIAVGTAAIAAGLAIGGGGGRQNAGSSGAGAGAGVGTQTSAFSQQQIATQQHFSRAAESLRESSENLNSATDTITGVPAGQVFMQGAKENGGVTRVLASDARRSENFSATRDAARAFQG